MDSFVFIENDCRHTSVKTEPVTKPLEELTAEEIINRVRNAGIVDSGSGLPLWQMLGDALNKAKRIVINATECEPWSTASHRILREQGDALIKGIKILIYTLGVRKADIAVEETEGALIKTLSAHIKDKALIDIKVTAAKHPMGAPRQLIHAIYSKRIAPGKTVYDTGYAIFTPETAVAVYRALATGMPMIHRRITVEGDGIKECGNIIVPIGTSFDEIAQFCGSVKKKCKRIIAGGALTGVAVTGEDVVDKLTKGALFLSARKERTFGCIRCGKCIDVCPVGLTPALIAAYSRKEIYDECARLGAAHCINCGCCAYSCPSGIPLSALIQNAKEVYCNEREDT